MSIGTDADVDLDGHLKFEFVDTLNTNSSVSANAEVGAILGGALGLNLSGIPNAFDIGISQLPKLFAKLDPLTLNLNVSPIDFSLRLREIPSIRMHFPTHFKVGFALFGREFFSASLCGQAQIITEPYTPNPCERVRARMPMPG